MEILPQSDMIELMGVSGLNLMRNVDGELFQKSERNVDCVVP